MNNYEKFQILGMIYGKIDANGLIQLPNNSIFLELFFKRYTCVKNKEQFITFDQFEPINTFIIKNPTFLTREFDFSRISSEVVFGFILGYFEVNGSISSQKCKLKSDNDKLLKWIEETTLIPCIRTEKYLEWEKVNCLEFLEKIYNNKCFPYILSSNYSKFLKLSNPFLTNLGDNLPYFIYEKIDKDAISPTKSRFSDVGFDLHIIKLNKEVNGVYYFGTGLKVQPPFGFYFQLVSRSSTAKKGWILANSVGIIDPGYTGEIIVAFVKHDNNAESFKFPDKCVQLIPCQLNLFNSIEKNISITTRADGGFGSTDK